MVLTPEQQERIAMNRKRALAIQAENKRKRKIQQQQEQQQQQEKKEKVVIHPPLCHKKTRTQPNDKEKEEKTVELEEFEFSASEFVTQTEAMKMYCLPTGTLAVCQVTERENPRHPSWTPMKLYRRSEIRRLARERYGGVEGLQQERRKRADKRYLKDLQETRDIFG